MNFYINSKELDQIIENTLHLAGADSTQSIPAKLQAYKILAGHSPANKPNYFETNQIQMRNLKRSGKVEINQFDGQTTVYECYFPESEASFLIHLAEEPFIDQYGDVIAKLLKGEIYTSDGEHLPLEDLTFTKELFGYVKKHMEENDEVPSVDELAYNDYLSDL